MGHITLREYLSLPVTVTLADVNGSRYVYFEKVRILEGKKKTPKRQRNEEEYRSGLPLEDRRRVWVFGPA
jgi:hypothetical protein